MYVLDILCDLSSCWLKGLLPITADTVNHAQPDQPVVYLIGS